MNGETHARIRVGIGGWNYAPWRGVFYPRELPQKEELAYASGKLSSIEINATYYRSQTPESFARWHDATPEDFVFSLKAPRFATNRRVAEAGESIERFFNSGVAALRGKLGPILWQFMPTKKFDPDDFTAFLDLLPESVEGRTIRHAIEVRHDSFATPEFVALARDRGVAVVVAGDSKHPLIADVTAPFVYARVMGTRAADESGYSERELDAWARRAREWSSGVFASDLASVSDPPARAKTGRDVFFYVISGCKARNPAAAMAIIARLEASGASG